MNSMIQPGYAPKTYSPSPKACRPKQRGTQGKDFFDMAARASQGTAGVPESSLRPKNTGAYIEHLKKKYGQVTIKSVGRDQASLQKAGGSMRGHDVVIAPNILENMANDPKKAAYYEQKIDDFFSATPKLKAYFAAQGLTYEPCGVVVHEDGSVTYICGGGDSPERVAEVNRINSEKAKKKAEGQKQYQEQAAAAAIQRRAMWERAAAAEALKRPCSNTGGLLKTPTADTPAAIPEVSFPAGVTLFFLNL